MKVRQGQSKKEIVCEDLFIIASILVEWFEVRKSYSYLVSTSPQRKRGAYLSIKSHIQGRK